MVSYVVVKAPPAESFKKAETRERFVRFVADLLSAGRERKYAPHQLNVGTTDLQWGVDAGNDWWVFFDQDDPTLARIQHRYGVREALDPLCAWIAYSWRATVVQPVAVTS